MILNESTYSFIRNAYPGAGEANVCAFMFHVKVNARRSDIIEYFINKQISHSVYRIPLQVLFLYAPEYDQSLSVEVVN